MAEVQNETMMDLTARPQVATLRVPRLEEIDFKSLRAERLRRLQDTMQRYDLPVCVFFNPANIRYATGSATCYLNSLELFWRYCVVPAEGEPILFEVPGTFHHAAKLVNDVRPAHSWAYLGDGASEPARQWAREMSDLLRELGLTENILGVDRLDTPGFLALQEEGIHVVDSGPATVDAREVKTPEEVELFKFNGSICSAMLAEFEAAIRPGVREYELLAVLHGSLVRLRGEFGFLRMVGSGANTNPWWPEAGDKLVMPGDLVGVDTDAHGYEGYVIDVSRTFLCGDVATAEQKEAYRVAHDAVAAMVETVKPGMTYREFVDQLPPLPEKYRQQRYPVMAHTVGLEDGDGPGIPYPDLEPVPEREFKENMVMNFECYAGAVGAPFGVKLEDQILVTEHGAELLVTYPYEAKLLD
jgi:Xaa-Pro aminopeptidase